MDFFDCNFRIGFEHKPLYTWIETTGQIIDVLDCYGIRKVLVYHTLAKNYDPNEGNRLLSDTLSEVNDRLMPLYVFKPYTNSPLRQLDYIKGEIRHGNLKGVILEPYSGRYTLSRRLFKQYFAFFDQIKFPVFIDFESVSLFKFTLCYEQLDDLLSAYKNIPIILMNTGYRIDIELYDLAGKWENLYVEISCYQSNRAVEHFAKTFGSERLLFGSRFPEFCPGAAIYKIKTAFLREDEKQNIAYKNLERIIAGV